jgi:signal transduction histidine kinase
VSLRTKFTFYSSFLILFIIIIFSESIFLAQKNLLLSQYEEDRKKIFKDLVYNCIGALVVNDVIQIDNIVKSVVNTHNPAIVYAGFISSSDVVLFSSRDPDHIDKLKQRIVRVSRARDAQYTSPINENIIEFSHPFEDDTGYKGTLTAGFSQKYLDHQIKEALGLVKLNIIRISIFSLILGIVLSNVLAFYINKPIKALAAAADEIGKGNLELSVSIDRNDEIGKLGTTFNQMVKKLKELDELKDGFVSSVSHELRSPLAAIDGYCDYLLEGIVRGLPQEKQEKSLKIIKDATIRLTNFINNILDVAKIKAGKFEVRKMSVDIQELVQEIVSLFESLSLQQNKHLSCYFEGEVPPINADPEKIKQVITNLIGNAMKFTPENAEIIISARLADDLVEVWVADTGIGIPQESLGKVFDKFYQVKESEMKKPKGTGLGLAIVAEIVKLHDGQIWVESELGKGSIFKFTVPVWHE